MKESTKLTIVQLNDVHGHILPHKEVFLKLKELRLKKLVGILELKL